MYQPKLILLILLLLLFSSFSYQCLLTFVHWNLNDTKSPHVTRILFSMLADLINAIFGIVSACPQIYNPTIFFIQPLGILPSAPVTICITVTFMFHCYYLFNHRNFFIAVQTGGFNRSLHDFSQYLGPSYQCCNLDCLDSSSDYYYYYYYYY